MGRKQCRKRKVPSESCHTIGLSNFETAPQSTSILDCTQSIYKWGKCGALFTKHIWIKHKWKRKTAFDVTQSLDTMWRIFLLDS